MSGPEHNPLKKQGSLSHIEQSLKIIPTPPQQAPVTIYPGPKAGNFNLSKTDLEIADRLEKLRKKDVDLPTEEEMASRLAQLKGLPCDHYSKPSGVIYQAPDNRTNTEKSNDLLQQVLQEVALDAKVPKAEDEIANRLSRLRGDPASAPSESRPSEQPCVALPPEGGPKTMDLNEVEELMREAQKEVGEARASYNALRADKELGAAIKETTGKRHKLTTSKSASMEEKYSESDSSDEEQCRASRGDPKASQKEAEEVERVVQLYTKKAQQKKERRKRRALRKKDAKDSDSSSAELSSSDLKVSTSESENLSDSD